MKKTRKIRLILMTALLASCANDQDSWDQNDGNTNNDNGSGYYSYYHTGWYSYPFMGRSFYQGPFMYSNEVYYSHGYAAESPISRGGFGSTHSSSRGAASHGVRG